jgi:hypothetical protein
MATYRIGMEAALDGLDDTALRDDWKPNSRAIPWPSGPFL